ncbi:MAG: glycosyltransferase [Cytophagales bacterium CG18_big_fil_WC_8_21_14_2_50_42_9]|nr:MAG: glycosyltransferase [Cytophagales bacterium CG18_big_fil_WC_8_21_14_2_50_42_9]
MSDSLLIIFLKNPILGKVKTRLAATIGPEKALEVYHLLLERTQSITCQLPGDKVVYYSDVIDSNDIWDNNLYKKELQQGADLGDKMQQAFMHGFEQGYQHICLIGSDCYELSDEIITDALDKLQNIDLVLGPTLDGGYYLIGLKKLHPELFANKKWSTDSVLQDTLMEAKNKKISFALLPTLTDVDEEKDLISIDDLLWD